MAPDITQIGASGSTVSNGGADAYQIPDITFRDPKNRRLKVLTIGAGVSGIMMAYNIQKQCEK
jgi:cation diffusion facilitator CzcD-associated flavoprotein CzcO